MKRRNAHKLVEEVALYIMTASHERLQQMTRYSIAESFCINECSLSTLFRKVTNTKLSEYMEREKMFRARVLLLREQFPTIEELSTGMGIAKVNHFRKKFRRTFIVPPGKYKKHVRTHPAGRILTDWETNNRGKRP